MTRRRLAVALLVIAAAACSRTISDPARPGSAPASTPTTTASSTVAGDEGTTTTRSSTAPCIPSTELGGTPNGTPTVVTDVDGDGVDDTLGVRSTDSSQILRIDLGAGHGALEAVLDDASGTIPARVLGTSGRIVFVAVDVGASATVVGLEQVSGCTLTRLATGSGGPESFPIGGSVTHLGGLRCGTAGGLDVLSAESTDGETYTTTDQHLHVGDGVLEEGQPPTTGTLSAGDPALQAYAHLVCPGVEAL